MNAPHFRSDDHVSRIFNHHVMRGRPDVAVRSVIQGGLSVSRDDIETPHLDALGHMSAADRGEYALQHAAEIRNERAAINLVASQDNIRRDIASTAAATKDADRAAFVKARILELEAAHHARLRAEWTAQAETEAAAKFDAPPALEPPPTQPELARAKRRPQ